jgi:hypothetical protein
MIKKTLMKLSFVLSIPIAGGIIMASCSNQPQQQNATTPKKDSAVKKNIDTSKAKPVAAKPMGDTVTPNRKFNDEARFIAGMKQLPGSSLMALEKDTFWIRYAKNFDAQWNQVQAKRIKPMSDWAATELAAERKSNLDVFYPFSGPDILHANAFFPNAHVYHLYALERAGAVPDVAKMKTAAIDTYLTDLYASLADVFTKSYFITKNMLTDLQRENVNGTLTPICVFLVRSGHEIVNVKYFHLNENGTETQLKKDSAAIHTNDFVKVYFKNPADSSIQVVTYMKCDLSDNPLKANKGISTWLNNMPMSITYIKSASYLLQNSFFSVMRDYILKKSQSIVQDDTGMPFKYMGGDKWNISLYGVYIKPVSSFPVGFFQTDLEKAYKVSDSLKMVKKLPFSLGYHWGTSLQNLIKAERKG